MKRLNEEVLVIIGFLTVIFLVILLGFGTDAYYKHLDTYNTQKDREMFLKSYEMVMECRKNSSLINIDKVCGELPIFIDKVS